MRFVDPNGRNTDDFVTRRKMIFTVRFEVITVVLLRIQVFGDVMLSCCVSGKQCASSWTA
jgi:hypothetical protein